jgi:H+/gluconate symporter-like permease
MSVVGILIALGLLVWLAYRGWTILLLAPLCALIAALLAGQLLLANRTQTFMGNAAGFVGQFFPIFLLGALFGKLMEASGSVEVIAKYLTERLGTKRAMLAIVLAGEFVTYGGVSLFVAFFVLAPMGHALFKAANIPQRPDGRGHRTRKEDACVGQSTLLPSRSNMGAPTAFSSC